MSETEAAECAQCGAELVDPANILDACMQATGHLTQLLISFYEGKDDAADHLVAAAQCLWLDEDIPPGKYHPESNLEIAARAHHVLAGAVDGLVDPEDNYGGFAEARVECALQGMVRIALNLGFNLSDRIEASRLQEAGRTH